MRIAPASGMIATGLVAVLRAPSADAYLPVMRTLVEAGVVSVEVTLTTPGTLEVLEHLRSQLPETAEIGVGTVRTAHDAAAAIAAGARFLATPTFKPAVIETAVRAGIPVYSGAMTPTEVEAAWDSGSSAVKLFPAATVGPGFLSSLREPLPDVAVLPSGGIALPALADWFAAGAIAVSVGSPLIGSVFADLDTDALTRRAGAFLAALKRVSR